MPLPTCQCNNGLPVQQQLANIYCALYDIVQTGGGGGGGNVTAAAPLDSDMLVIGQGGSAIATMVTGTGVIDWLQSPTAANLATLTGDKTGTGNLVFASSPTINAATLTGVTTATTLNVTNFNATTLNINGGAAPVVSAFGDVSSDNNSWAASRGALVFFDGTASTTLVGVLTSDAPSNGQVPTWNTGGTITWETPSGSAAVLGGGAACNPGTGSTFFPGNGSLTNGETSASNAGSPCPRAGTASKFYARVAASALSAGQNVTFYLVVNGTRSALTCSLTGDGTTTLTSDTTHTVSLAAGDIISIEWNTTLGTPGSCKFSYSMTLS